ncbi:MAG: translation initiation factor [Sulfuricurvum sp.]|jgi:translation initiation factor 1|nr:translation initiation factor [Sulfuricurvum sp.]
MSRGTKLSLDIGASWNEGWSLEEDRKTSAAEILTPPEHRLVFQREKRKGKIVTLVGPFSLAGDEAQKTLSTLKKSLACGGAYKEGWMEFQGDIAPQLRAQLEKLSYRFKK